MSIYKRITPERTTIARKLFIVRRIQLFLKTSVTKQMQEIV